MRIRRPVDTPAPNAVVGSGARKASAASARADLVRKFATRAKPDPAIAAQRQAKIEALAIRDATRRADRTAAIAAIEQENRDRKAAALADTARIAEEARLFAADQAMFAAQAEADKIALVALRKSQRDARYAVRAARAKSSR